MYLKDILCQWKNSLSMKFSIFEMSVYELSFYDMSSLINVQRQIESNQIRKLVYRLIAIPQATNEPLKKSDIGNFETIFK